MVGFVAWGLETIRLLQLGVSTNWFGLGCPSHCGSPAWPSLILAYLLGLFCGLAISAFLGTWIWYRAFFPASSPAPHPLVRSPGSFEQSGCRADRGCEQTDRGSVYFCPSFFLRGCEALCCHSGTFFTSESCRLYYFLHLKRLGY